MSKISEKRLKEKLSLLPFSSGVYLMKNNSHKIIYVGKAANLKNRVKSYFSSYILDMKTKHLVENIYDFEYIITNTEKEAFILEDTLIKKYKPKYNILLKDDKRYPFIKITKEDFPQVIVSRDYNKDDGFYFGPYTDVKAMKYTLSLIFQLFQIRLCKQKISKSKLFPRPCLNFQIKKCLAPCVGKISFEEYNFLIDKVKKFLKGKNEIILAELKEKMFSYAENLKFEQANLLKSQIENLLKTTSKQNVYFTDDKDKDVVAGYLEENYGAIAVLKINSGRLTSKETYPLKNVEKSSYLQVLEAFLKQYYLDKLNELPYQIIIDKWGENLLEINSLLSNKLFVPQKGEVKNLLLIAQKNAFRVVEEEKLKSLRKKARSTFAVRELKEKLELLRIPYRIACLDISTIQGTNTVSSLVYFENGKPKKKNYLHFAIKTFQKQDDFAAIRETLERYFAKLNQYEVPDLLIIDGGKGQLSSAYTIMQKYKIQNIELISLAKRLEEVFLPNIKESVLLPRNSFAFKLLIKIRDEAHRFAISYHRKKREKSFLNSFLDKIVSENIKFELLNKFKSVENIKKASEKELQEIKGIGKVLSEKILKNL